MNWNAIKVPSLVSYDRTTGKPDMVTADVVSQGDSIVGRRCGKRLSNRDAFRSRNINIAQCWRTTIQRDANLIALADGDVFEDGVSTRRNGREESKPVVGTAVIAGVANFDVLKGRVARDDDRFPMTRLRHSVHALGEIFTNAVILNRREDDGLGRSCPGVDRSHSRKKGRLFELHDRPALDREIDSRVHRYITGNSNCPRPNVVFGDHSSYITS